MLKAIPVFSAWKSLRKQKIRSFLAFACILSITIILANNIFFMHMHKLPDGAIIIHAHPYQKSSDTAPIKHHHHSKTDLFFIQNIHLLFFAAIIVWSTFLLHLQIVRREFSLQSRKIYPLGFRLGRSPPCIC